jgi:hypothetical protein
VKTRRTAGSFVEKAGYLLAQIVMAESRPPIGFYGREETDREPLTSYVPAAGVQSKHALKALYTDGNQGARVNYI